MKWPCASHRLDRTVVDRSVIITGYVNAIITTIGWFYSAAFFYHAFVITVENLCRHSLATLDSEVVRINAGGEGSNSYQSQNADG